MPRWEAWITLTLLKSFETKWNTFHQKYHCTQILHPTGVGIKWFTCPLSHRPWLAKKKEEWKSPSWQDTKTPHQVEPGGKGGQLCTGQSVGRDPHEHLPSVAGKERHTFSQMCHQLWLPRLKGKQQNTDENNSCHVQQYATWNSLKKGNAPRDLLFKISAAPTRKTAKFTLNALEI